MNTNSKRLGIYIVIMMIATSVATTLRSIACVKYLDNYTGLFRDKSLVSIANVIIVMTAIGMVSYALVASGAQLRASFSTGSTYVPTGILGVATAFVVARIFDFILAFNNYRLFDFGARNASEIIAALMSRDSIITSIALATALLAILSIAHHFLNAYQTGSQSIARSYFAMASIGFLALYAVLIYLDETVSVNDPNKVLRQISFLFAAAFLLYEARISLGREMWRAYSVFGLIAAMLAAYTSIPALFAYYVNGEILSSSGYRSIASLEEYVLLLALFIFIVSRLCLTVMLKEEKENELVKTLATAAAARAEQVKESFDRHREIFASKQLSIFDLYEGSEPTEEEIEEEIVEPEEIVEEESTPIISDDAIYESIFGKMPEKPKVNEPEPEVIEDDREPEEIAEDLLNAIDEALKDDSDI